MTTIVHPNGTVSITLSQDCLEQLLLPLLATSPSPPMRLLHNDIVEALTPTLDKWLETTLGGPPESILNQSADHFSLVVDTVGLMKLAGPRWQQVVNRLRK